MSEKILCSGAKMNVVASARTMAGELVKHESRGPGDMENAMHRLEARYGIPWRTFWTLRYRPPADVMAGVYHRLMAAYQAECDRQMRLLRHELETTERKAGPDAPAVRQARAVVDAMDGD